MKRFHFVATLGTVAILAVSCNSTEEVKDAGVTHDWLLGDWIRTNDSEGQQTYETWKRLNDSTLVGIGCTLVNGDTVFKEDLTLVEGDRLEVRGVGDGGPVFFRMNASTDSSFVVENPDNEFPKQIHYMRTKFGLSAVISGDGNENTFLFEKRE